MNYAKPDRKLLTVPVIAKSAGVNQAKVLGWIHAGELRAINVASTKAVNPRWRIAPEDLAAFEEGRANRPAMASASGSRRSSRPATPQHV